VVNLTLIFKRASVTYYNSSVFFPPQVRRDVTKLYAFVRVFDDLVDSIPQKAKEFYELRSKYYEQLDGKDSNDLVLKNFVDLMRRKNFDKEWVDAFLDAMESDLKKSVYYTIDELLEYIYGSAEVVGVMMAKILDLPEESYYYARMLGRAMQYINFIRDVEEDMALGRQYLPFQEMMEFKTSLLDSSPRFNEFIRFQISRYFEYQKTAEKGYSYIPFRYLIAIKTAADMYKWTAKKIWNNPQIIKQRKIKPKKRRVIAQGIYNALGVYFLRNFLSF